MGMALRTRQGPVRSWEELAFVGLTVVVLVQAFSTAGRVVEAPAPAAPQPALLAIALAFPVAMARGGS